MSQTLRPYQNECVESVFEAAERGISRILYTMATGCGKTSTFAEITRRFTEFHGKKVLVLAHRRELITQAYDRIKNHCGLDEWGIGIELAESRAPKSAQVVVGSVQTVKGLHRLPEWTPDVIITDEAHRSAASSYRAIYKRFGVEEGKCLHIGCTATAKRTDRQSLYAMKPDGTRVVLTDKRNKSRYEADPLECVYHTHCYEFSVLDAIEGGWLVPIVGHSVQTSTNLDDVETDTDGDFKEGQLQKAVDNAERTIEAINAWKEIAGKRQTIVFCAGVEHAYHAAELWNQAFGEGTAAALGGEEAQDTFKRAGLLSDFQQGKLRVLCNMGLFTEGTDLPTCACIVHLRPTKSWNLFVQMTGRGSRVLPGVLEGIDDAYERRAAIAASAKPDCIVIDMVDICESNDLCTVPSILDLPINLDLEGHSLTAAKKLLDEFEEVKAQVIGECPTTFRQLQVRLEQVQMIRNSGAKSAADWKASADGFRFTRNPIGYQTQLLPAGDKQFDLVVTHGGGELLRKRGKPSDDFSAYLDKAREYAMNAIEEHRQSIAIPTCNQIADNQYRCLRANGYSVDQINNMTTGYAKKLAGQLSKAYWEKKKAQQSELAAAGAAGE